MEKLCIGVDVGGTSVKLGLFEITGTMIHKWEVPSRTEDDGSHILPDVAASIQALFEERSIALDDVVGIGIGVPGPVLPDGSVEVCVNLGWKNRNPQNELGAYFPGLCVKSDNDANVAALGEMWQGGGKGNTDIVMITLGTGVGGGVVLDGRIVSGKHGLAGEIGHVHVRDEETEVCNCGGVGCLEQIASATGIAREARRKMAASDIPSSMREFGSGITAKEVLDAAKAGDALANEVVEIVGRYLGLILSHVALTVDPQMFVIGGGVSRAGQFLIDVVEKYYQLYSPISKNKGGIGLAQLGNDAGIYGAAKLILD